MSLHNIAEIDTASLVSNINQIKKRLNKGVKICAVVKANAYGHGAAGIAERIEGLVDYFAVALVEEGVELRIAGISKPILVLLPTDDEGVERAIRYSLELSAGSFPDVEMISETAESLNEIAFVHIKINTGMNRMGFEPSELENACREISKRKHIKVSGCYSHFYNCESSLDMRLQAEKFEKAKHVVEKYFASVIYHLSASGGIIAGNEYNYDMVRPGILIYGYKPFDCDIDVKPILKIKAKVIKERALGKGEHLLYGNYTTDCNEKVAIVRAGYADGLRRNDKFSLNKRCMDVSAARGSGEYITVFEDAQSVADAENTISYEILCGITARSRIIYKD